MNSLPYLKPNNSFDLLTTLVLMPDMIKGAVHSPTSWSHSTDLRLETDGPVYLSEFSAYGFPNKPDKFGFDLM